MVANPSIIEDTLMLLRDKHALFMSEFPELKQINDNLLTKLTTIMLEAQQMTRLTDSKKDEIFVIGEQFMARCFSFYLTTENLGSKVFFPEMLDFFTDGQFDNAVVELSQSYNKLISTIHQNTGIIIIPGFYGISHTGLITTFGRSGSDYTATVLANILDAEKVIIWKDVNGFMSADPKIVSSAVSIAHLEYEEAAELAHFGAKVLHPKAVIPVALKKIPIEIRNIYTQKYTIISTDHSKKPTMIKSISYMQDISLVKVHIAVGARQSGIIHIITEYLSGEKINILSLTTSNTILAFLIQNKDTERVSSTLKSLNNTIKLIDNVECFDGLALICIVGKGLDNISTLSRVLTVLDAMRITIHTISAGASSITYQFAIKEEDLGMCINSIHKELFTTAKYHNLTII